jgi:hypothetical protein
MATRLGQKFKEKLEKKPTDLTLLTDVDFDEIGEVVAKPVLRLLYLVCRRSVLLEGPGRVAEVSQGPWQNFRPQHFPIPAPRTLTPAGTKNNGVLPLCVTPAQTMTCFGFCCRWTILPSSDAS